MANRTLGWVQNPNRLETLRYVTEIFLYDSNGNRNLREQKLPLLLRNQLISQEDYDEFLRLLDHEGIEIPYGKLKGKGPGAGCKRADALCTGIVQAAIDAQGYRELKNEYREIVRMKKPYTDDWTAHGYVSWAIATGLLEYDNKADSCKISPLGEALAGTAEGSALEKEVFTRALFSYPPVNRILDILNTGEAYTKFELGERLGFVGERGFNTVPQDYFVASYCEENSQEKKKNIKANVEGDPEKYARTIASWLIQMGWVCTCNKQVTSQYLHRTYTMELQAFSITVSGRQALKRAQGGSSRRRIPKIVLYEMLGTKTENVKYVRYRRAHVILELASGERSLTQLRADLKEYAIEEPEAVLLDDIRGLENIGLAVKEKGGKYRILDKIEKLSVPESPAGIVKTNISALKSTISSKLLHIDHKYLVLVDLAYSDASTRKKKNSDARDFEIETAALFTKELEFSGERMGNASRPDVIIYHDTFGTIIDNKSYRDGFSVDGKCADEMNRYVEENQNRMPGVPKNEWWRKFPVTVTEFSFLFITSFLKGNFSNNLEQVSRRRGVNGGAIGVEQLLYLAEQLKSGKMDYSSFSGIFHNDEIFVSPDGSDPA